MSQTRLRLALISCSLACFLAPPAFAQIAGTPYELSAQGGWFAPDARAHVKSAPGFGGTLGWRAQSWFVLEGQAFYSSSKADTLPEQKSTFLAYGLDLRLNLRPAENRTVPYLLIGYGAGSSKTTGTPPDELTRGIGALGLGVLLNLGSPHAYLRIQARDTWFRERNAKEFGENMALTAGLHWIFGGKPKDTDLDGVPEWKDECPNTPIGATVDAKGCPKDSDGDGVLDGIDKCPNTPKGCTIDRAGCPGDADDDGVCDGLDKCANTPKGATVDASGCPSDDDGDGVPNGIDQCPNTPKGATVDAKGCPSDDDKDGVPNGLDKCPGTAPGLKVDKDGCPIEVMEKETELLDTGMIRLQNVNFETNKADILPESFPVLDIVGQVLKSWPELKIEIGGHTDSRGSDAHNQKLSEARANSVKSYLTQKFPELKPEQYTTQGYGESRPLVPNNSELNMAKNRRVEFVVLNRDVLRKETERRRLLKQGEGAPADTTGKH